MALDRFRRLSHGFEIKMASSSSQGKTWVYRLDPKKVEGAFLRKRSAVNRWAERRVKDELINA
jgi:hypothetical protein